MNIQLINTPNPEFSAIEQILYNRGIAANDIYHYTHLSDADINDAEMLGVERLKAGVAAIIDTIKNNNRALVVVDCDCDGYTASALLINYLYRLFPSWVIANLDWVMHDSKQHGLSDHMDLIQSGCYKLVIAPDSSSNDYIIHQQLQSQGISVLVLDHHLADKISPSAIVINNQLSDYPNKELSGVGVTWQFCRYIDKLLNYNYANEFLDLVALGNCGDMMSLTSFETRYLITKGFLKENIKNPFIEYMIDKNEFPLSKAEYKPYQNNSAITSIGAAFFIVPFINAVTRSGTIEEKEMCFKSMLEYEAFKKIPEIKRNKKTGNMEYLVLQAVRVVSNVKNRQTRAEDAGMELLEGMIADNDMLKHKILLFLLEPGQIEPEIRGLIANKFMAKYQRPCAILTKTLKDIDIIDNQNSNKFLFSQSFAMYEGSMRGYTKNGLDSFKELLEQCPEVAYVQGHDNAAGLGIYADLVESFLTRVDVLMEEVSADPIYRVDYSFTELNADPQKIIEIGGLNDYWGQDIDRAYISIRFKITDSNFAIMKSNTLKITLPNGISIVKFGGTEEDIETFTTTGYVELEAYCECRINEWNGIEYPQLILKEYEVIDSAKYYF